MVQSDILHRTVGSGSLSGDTNDGCSMGPFSRANDSERDAVLCPKSGSVSRWSIHRSRSPWSSSRHIRRNVSFGEIIMFDNNLSIDDMIEGHREYGDHDLAEALEYIRDNEDSWREGNLRPEDVPGYEYDTALYVLNCITFGRRMEANE